MKIFKNIGALVFSSTLLAACQTGDSQALVDLSPQEFATHIKAKGDSVLLIDVRTPEEFQSGHIPGALLLNYQDAAFAAEVAKLPRDKQVYVYCRSGRRSKSSGPVFLDAGFKKVVNLAEGIIGWRKAGLAVE